MAMTSLRPLLLAVLMLCPALSGRADEPARDQARAASAVATFAAGCFWCVERDFDKVKGVLDTTSGYTGGHTPNPTYDDVTTDETGHVEAVRVTYDPTVVTYAALLAVYWHNVDPIDGRGQFCDRGSAYRPVIFYHDDEQKRLAEASFADLESSHRFSRPIAVKIEPAGAFTKAEDEHQNFFEKHPFYYSYFRAGCGRDARLTQLWGMEGGHGR